MAPGYAGGEGENPSYEEVSTGKTGHVEAVQVEYNPEEASYQDLLRVFWEAHDPTQENRQGPDVGSQYQAAAFYHTEEERRLAEESKKEKEKEIGRPVATKILPFQTFYPAEDEHKDYYERHPDAPYARQVIDPKLQKLRRFLEL